MLKIYVLCTNICYNAPIKLPRRCHMAISSNNVQVYTTLSKELVAEIDKDAKDNFRTRSQQINMILTEYYKTKTTTDDEKK